MTRQKFRLLTLGALMSAAMALPALAQEGGTPSPDSGKPAMERPQMEGHRGGIMKEADANKDGFITKEELMAAHEKRTIEMFEKLDTDKDGKLSKDELKAGREAMRAKMKERMEERKGKMQEHMGKMKEKMGKMGDTPADKPETK